MTYTVHCRKYGKPLPGLTMAPLPGAKGQEIYQTVSQQAWSDWMQHQTRLINEKHLNMMEPAARKYLQEQMDKFLSNQDFDKPEGYVPETAS